jgi:probable rRNA maturation factor
MKIELFNLTKENLDEYFETIRKVLVHGINKLNVGDVSFNIIIVDNPYIHKLNKDYRGIDRETDVISFALEDDKTFNPEERILGDIYISIDKAKSQSEEYHHSLMRELCFLSVHGMLHLLGYDHMNPADEKEMFSIQEEILDEMDIKR